MVIYPVVVEPNAKWSGTVYWRVTLVDREGGTASKAFTVTYLARQPSPPPPPSTPIPQPDRPHQPVATKFRYPLEKWQIAQDFNIWNKCAWGYHLGVDIPAKPDTPVYPIADGVVKFADKVMGYTIVIQHKLPNSEYICSVYYHLKLPENGGIKLQKDMVVNINGPIGYISGKPEDHGNTFPHLHLGIRKGNCEELLKRGKDPRTGHWYFPGYTSIINECSGENEKKCKINCNPPKLQIHKDIASEWYNPSNFLSEMVSQSSRSPKPEIISDLKILEPGPYRVGQTITAEFTIRNSGNAPITFDVLTVGGRLNGQCPNNKCPDFEFKRDITLLPNSSYKYQGKLKLELPGKYHFFTAYRTKDGQWNTSIPALPGVRNSLDILVQTPPIPEPSPPIPQPQPSPPTQPKPTAPLETPFKYINNLLEKAAKEYNVPACLLKAIAWVESKWEHCENARLVWTSKGYYCEDGKIKTGSNGEDIGIMQININNATLCNNNGLDIYKLEDNIRCGALILKSKWDEGENANKEMRLPPDDPNIVENWWYATIGYNGFDNRIIKGKILTPKDYLNKVKEVLINLNEIPYEIKKYFKNCPDGWTLPWELFPEFVVQRYRIDNFGVFQNGTMWYKPKGKKWEERKEMKGRIHFWEDYIIASIPSKMTTHVMDTTIENLQITKISPSVIETREQTYPVILTLVGKGFSRVNEISFCWRGFDTCYNLGGPRVWKKGDKNWVNSLKIESDEKMTLKIYVLYNEPPANEVKEWTWTVTLRNDKGETASKEFKVRYLPFR
jgi:murein DD-endopeptidase MepM/ murein hydrolase activator NlpD